MAAPSSPIIAIDLGAYSIKVGMFRPQGTGLIVDSFFTAPLGPDASTEEGRNGVIAQILQTALSNQRIKSVRVVYSVPFHSVFMRFVKLPQSAPDQVAQMVRFEAANNVPFPLEEVVWDYQLLGNSSGEVESIIAAMKAEVLDHTHAALATTGAQAEIVDIAPLALYNAVRFNYGESSGSTLVVDIGAKTTQLVFIEPGRVFVRGVPIAGNQITQGLATDMGISFDEAEHIKTERGFVGLGGAYEDPPDELAARASKIIRQQMTRLHAEITRSMVSYRTQQGGSAPTQILLAGGSSALPYANMFFQEKMRVAVDYFNPLRNVVVGPTADRASLIHSGRMMGEVVGLALRATGPCPIEINLKPAGAAKSAGESARMQLAVGAGTAWAAALGALWFANFQAANVLAEQLDTKKTELEALRQVDTRLEVEKKALAAGDANAKQAAAVGDQKGAWKGLLDELNKIVPTGVWITSLQPANGATPLPFLVPAVGAPAKPKGKEKEAPPPGTSITDVIIGGLFESYPSDLLKDPTVGRNGDEEVRNFLDRIRESPFFQMSEKDTTDQNLVTKQIISVGDKRLAASFKIQAKLKNPIPLVP